MVVTGGDPNCGNFEDNVQKSNLTFPWGTVFQLERLIGMIMLNTDIWLPPYEFLIQQYRGQPDILHFQQAPR